MGIDSALVAKWWAGQGPSLVASLGDFAAEVLLGKEVGEGGASDAARVLVSAKEERDLEELLDMFAMGLGNVQEFETRLADEHDALEAANVHSLLGSVPQVDGVVGALRKTAHMLDDIDETLQVFETKLRSMRQDIGAIEQCNNSLDLNARNNARLQATLKGLLSDLKLSADTRNILESPPFEKEKNSSLIKAGWVLVAKVARLDPSSVSCLPKHLLQMRVVREARDDLGGLAQRFVARGTTYLCARLHEVVEELAVEVGRSTDKAARTRPADHGRLASLRTRYAELLRLLKAMDPEALDRTRSTYINSVNMLLRKELRAASAELRKAAAMAAYHHPLDLGLAKDTPGLRRGSNTAASVQGGSDAASVMGDLEGGRLGSRGPGSTLSRTSLSALSIQQMLKRPHGVFDGTSLSIPLNEAWSSLLEHWLPSLLEELEAAATFLLLTAEGESSHGDGSTPGPVRLTSEGQELLVSLVAGAEPEFQLIIGLGAKGGLQVLGLPMLASTTWWLQQLAPSYAARPLINLLADCHAKLRAQLAVYRAAQLQAVEGYAAKASSGVKSMHVLACTSQFALLSHYLEQLLAESQDAIQLLQAQEDPSGSPFLSTQSIQAGGGRSSLFRADSRAVGASSLNNALSMALMREASDEELDAHLRAAAEWQCRLEVDELYTALVGCMFSTLERMASQDPKHGERLRLENYAYFTESVRPLARLVSALEPYLEQAGARQEEALSAYVQQQLEYCPLWQLLQFSAKLGKLLEVVTPAEVAFQSGCSVSEARSLIHSAVKELGKQLARVSARVRKHLGNSGLTFRVWECFQEDLLDRYSHLDNLLAECYSQMVLLSPTPAELSDLLATVPRL